MREKRNAMKDKFCLGEASRCLLCENAPCSAACSQGDPARMLRAIRFDNYSNARKWIDRCTDEELEKAEKTCIHYDRPIRIREIAEHLGLETVNANTTKSQTNKAETKPDLSIEFCGMKCENPFFLASSAVCTNYEMVARAFEAGWAGVFYKTICLEDIHEVSPRFDSVREEGDTGKFYGFRNMEQLSENPAEVDFDILRILKENYPQKIVIASIMGQTLQDWALLAHMAEEAGLDAVELNFSCPQMGLEGMGSDVGQNVELVMHYTSYVKKRISLPVIVKMTPNITHISQPAVASALAGADAISAINTIKSVTMSDSSMVFRQRTVSGYSGRAVKPIALRYILEMAKNPILEYTPLSGIGGIETWKDALEFLQLGCTNVQVCTAVMQYGYRIIDDLTEGLRTYLEDRGLTSLNTVIGEELKNFVMPSDLDRSTIVYPQINRDQCIGCGRCHISCEDGGHQAITIDEDRKPHVNGAKCAGCLLCLHICPVGAIKQSKRVKHSRQ
jgi:dihydropyrimidine dehydrogenase (NAD+) subunit PreA